MKVDGENDITCIVDSCATSSATSDARGWDSASPKSVQTNQRKQRAASRVWTRKQARYDTASMVQGTTPGGGLPVQYTATRHGIVARAWLPGGLAEVALLRRYGHLRGTYQGCVERIDGGWRTTDAHGRIVRESAGDYLDAEAPLLVLRTGVRSQVGYHWPRELLRILRPRETW